MKLFSKTNFKVKGIFTLLILMFGVLYSCDGQIIVSDDQDSGYNFEFGIDTVYVDVPTFIYDTTYVDVPVPVYIHDTTYVDIIVEVPVYIHDTTYIDKIITVHDTILRDFNYDEMKEIVYLWAEADTVRTYSDVIQLDYTNSLQGPSTEPDIYAMVRGVGIVEINLDTVYSWQRTFDLERVKEFDHTTYNSIGLPFQLRNYEYYDVTQTSIGVRTWATEYHTIKYYVNDALEYDHGDKFGSTELSGIQYQHSHTITGLMPGVTYNLRIEVETEDGRKAVSENLIFNTVN